MSIIVLLLVLALVGIGLYAFNAKVTAIDPVLKNIINAVVIIAMIVYLLQAFGVLNVGTLRVR